MTFKFLLLISVILLAQPVLAETKIVSISQKVGFKTGDMIQLKDSSFSVQIEADPGTECAIPGFNCGSGYIPPHPKFKTDCGPQKPCPYIVMAFPTNATSGSLSIETQTSCETHQPEICFNQFAREIKSDEGCMGITSPMGRYYCLKAFESSKRPENKGLCDQLPESIYALKWNCFYEYAIRYRDPGFCDKYSSTPTDVSGRDRCLLKMAELLKDPSFCKKISISKDNSYRELCETIRFPQ